jgi:hypothetical protein
MSRGVLAWLLAAAASACSSRAADRGDDCAHLPPRDCADAPARCAELVRFAPARGLGYQDDALAAEQTDETSTSYLRRDLMMLVKYATAKVACTTGAARLGLGDMSDRRGDAPGAPRHPWGSHVGGADIDLAYYQIGTPDLRLRAICPHVVDGVDQRHCAAPPALLDARRTALLIGFLFESPHVRVVGVDGAAGPPIEAALRRACAARALAADACARVRLGFEPIDTHRGWYLAHHNHLHVSWAR